ncbi:MAG TPA: hypothetical protein VLM89_09275 [Phycisphaerae bacterium]|nr:hypothetical protein [Phycisphaerae bacterium]
MSFTLAAMLFLFSAAGSPLPAGNAPDPVSFPHFPDRLSTFVWRNWSLVPIERMAEVVGAKPENMIRIGKEMGLPDPRPIGDSQWRRSYITIIRRNWHLLPYDQLLKLLDWTAEQMAFTLREDDFLFHKLGALKPRCEPIAWREPDERALQRLRQIADVVRREYPSGIGLPSANLFDFLQELSAPLPADQKPATTPAGESRFSPRFCYSYFAVYGDPFLDMRDDPYPDGYLERLATSGVDGVWLQAVLYKLAPFPWDPKASQDYEKRLENLRRLVARLRRHGMGMYIYLNEPRAMPLAFFNDHPDLKGLVEGDHAALCTSSPAVRKYLADAIESICRAVPDLAGIFTITASENLTNCWAHHTGQGCPRCGPRGQADVLAELHDLYKEAIDRAGGRQKLIIWDWGWMDDAADATIERLPPGVSFMSVSEWSIPIERGGVKTAVGEYSISVIGPGQRARHRWDLARRKGLATIAKIQAGNTWELSAVPYIPAVAGVARHAANVRDAGVTGLMLGWTLGGCPSPNLDVVAEIGRKTDRPDRPTVDEALNTVATRWFGPRNAPAVVKAWERFSDAFSEFPYHGSTLYNAPLQAGPSNLLWSEPTGYNSTMVGFPYDHLPGWCSVYPPPVFIDQLQKVASGFEAGIRPLRELHKRISVRGYASAEGTALGREIDVADASAIHFQSVANQSRFVMARDALTKAATTEAARPLLDELERLLQAELDLARRLYVIQCRDSRIGFEASNQYNYVPLDLVEKVVNCRDLLDRWLPAQKRKWTP